MTTDVDHDLLNDALRRAGSNWNAAQSHGLASSRLAVLGPAAGPEWMSQVLEGTDDGNALRKECDDMLAVLLQSTYRYLEERLSAFAPLLPDDNDSPAARAEGLAHWCEGYLHGLVSAERGEALKERLSTEPLADIIKDMLQITRATVDLDSDDDDNEEALTEIAEYLRVAAQVIYEELAELRPGQAQ